MSPIFPANTNVPTCVYYIRAYIMTSGGGDTLSVYTYIYIPSPPFSQCFRTPQIATAAARSPIARIYTRTRRVGITHRRPEIDPKFSPPPENLSTDPRPRAPVNFLWTVDTRRLQLFFLREWAKITNKEENGGTIGALEPGFFDNCDGDDVDVHSHSLSVCLWLSARRRAAARRRRSRLVR